jgi:hypothetical protein
MPYAPRAVRLLGYPGAAPLDCPSRLCCLRPLVPGTQSLYATPLPGNTDDAIWKQQHHTDKESPQNNRPPLWK